MLKLPPPLPSAVATVLLALALTAPDALASSSPPSDLSGRHLMDNGMDVRFFPDSGTPLVATLALVRTGYASEDLSNSGYSHLLEHLVFAGTGRRGKEQIQREVKDMGGYINGFTRDDYTAYLIVGHRDHLERQLDILSDILFASVLPEQGVDEARSVVIEEIRRRSSRPDTRAEEAFQEVLYGGSSYERTGLGNEATVSAVLRQSILEYYQRTYRPDNVVLLMAGGMDEKAAMSALKRTFGAFGPGQKQPGIDPAPPLEGQRAYLLRTGMPDVGVRLGFNGPDPRSSDSEALEVFAGVLGGTGGILARALESAGMNPRSATAGLWINQGFSRFVVTVSLRASADPQAALKVILDTIPAILETGLPPEGIEEARDAMAAGEIMGREKIHYYLMGKAAWAIAGVPGQGIAPGRWDSVTFKDMAAAAERYLSGQPYAALLTLPENAANNDGAESVSARKRETLDNGLVIWAEQRAQSDVFAFHLMTRARSVAEPPGKAGIADFVHRLLPCGTTNRSRQELDAEVRSLGLSLSTAGNPMVPFGDFYTSRLYSYIRAECLDDRAERAMELVADMIRNPLIASDDVEEVRGKILDFIAYKDETPESVASRILARELYGEALAADVLGDRETISSISRGDLADFSGSYFTGMNMILSVVSGRPPEEAIELVREHFSDLPGGVEAPQLELSATSSPVMVERELGLAQGSLAVGAVTREVAFQDRCVLSLVGAILNQRLYDQLREKEGLAYSVGASLGEIGGKAVFTLSMGTGPEKMEQARQSVRREIRAARDMKVDPAQLEREVNGRMGLLQMRMLSSINRAYYLGLAEREFYDHTYNEDYRSMLLSFTPEDVKRAAARYLPADNLVEVVVR